MGGGSQQDWQTEVKVEYGKSVYIACLAYCWAGPGLSDVILAIDTRSTEAIFDFLVEIEVGLKRR